MCSMVELAYKGFQFFCPIFLVAKASLVYFNQDASSSLSRNTHSDRVWISYPRHVVHSVRRPSLDNFRSDRG